MCNTDKIWFGSLNEMLLNYNLTFEFIHFCIIYFIKYGADLSFTLFP